MAYRLTYSASVEWVAPGTGSLSNPQGPNSPGGNAQTLYFTNSIGETPIGGVSLPPTSTTFLAADLSTLLTNMQTDLSTQMTAQLTRIQNFSTGTG